MPEHQHVSEAPRDQIDPANREVLQRLLAEEEAKLEGSTGGKRTSCPSLLAPKSDEQPKAEDELLCGKSALSTTQLHALSEKPVEVDPRVECH
jgi:hypothetical protein